MNSYLSTIEKTGLAAEVADKARPLRFSVRRHQRLASLGKSFIWIFVLCLAMTGCQSEVAQWKFAGALNEEADGDLAAAVLQMKNALLAAPGDIRIKLSLAMKLSETGDRESIALCDDVLNAKGESVPKAIRLQALGCKRWCLQHLGEFGEALIIHKKLISGHVARDQTELNELAYYRALAHEDLSHRELMLAVADIDEAIAQESAAGWPSGLYLTLPVKATIAIGLIARHEHLQRDTLAMLSAKIEELDRDFSRVQAGIASAIYSRILGEFPLSGHNEKKEHLARNRQDVARGALASLLTTRALLYQDLGMEGASVADRIRVKELGFVANTLAEQMPSTRSCLATIEVAKAFLDTRGYLRGVLPWKHIGVDETVVYEDSMYQLGNFELAISDLNIAIESARSMRAALKGTTFNTPEFAPEEVKSRLDFISETESVLLFHRMEVYRRHGNLAEAEIDVEQIRELGFDPESNLF